MKRMISSVTAMLVGAVFFAVLSGCGGADGSNAAAPAAAAGAVTTAGATPAASAASATAAPATASASASAAASASTSATASASASASASTDAQSAPALDNTNAASASSLSGASGTLTTGNSMLRTSGRKIINASGATVQLKGFNLGGWFVMEDFMSPMDAGGLTDTHSIMLKLSERFGVTTQRALMKTYQETWINASDLDNIKNAGFNTVRVPVWWGQFFALNDPTTTGWRDDAFERLDWLVAAAAARNLYVIIDMHGVIGGQNVQATTGRANRNLYWTSASFQSNTAWMWWQIANHYKGNPTVAGYDLINEPIGAPDANAVWTAYASLYTTVRSADPEHMIFVEGTYGSWNWDMLPPPSKYGWTNIVYEMHEYQANASADKIKNGSEAQVADFNRHASWNVPGYIGEFNDFAAGAATWQNSITGYNNAGLSWTMWSYKAVNGVAPNPWGWYDPLRWPERPNVSLDSAEEIARKWSLWKTTDTFGQNSALGIKPAY